MPSVNPAGGPPIAGGPVGSCFNSLLSLDLATGHIDALSLDGNMAINEPVHVPSSTPGHEGWLIAVVDRELDMQHHESEVWILEAGNITAPPLAKVKLPVAMRPQVHGWWVSAADLAQARAGQR
jgi:carotenoid cleavage dioxygenase